MLRTIFEIACYCTIIFSIFMGDIVSAAQMFTLIILSKVCAIESAVVKN